MTFVRQEELVVLSLEGSGDNSCTGKFEATWLLTSDSFWDSKLDFDVIIFCWSSEVESLFLLAKSNC